MDKEVVKELIQSDFNISNLQIELQKILSGTHRTSMLNDYKSLHRKLGDGGASERAADIIVKL
jgi:lipid-A-disaccharide synthase